MKSSKTRWNVSLLTLAFAASAGAVALAQAPAATQEKPKTDNGPTLSAEQVLEKYVEATGGKAAYEKLKSRHIKATMEIKGQPQMKPTLETFEKAPTFSMQHMAIPGLFEQTRGFDGKIAWSKDPMSGLRELDGKELASMKTDSIFNKEILWRQAYKETKNLGRKKVEEKDVYEIELIPAEGNSTTNYYDATTFLLWMSKKVEETPQGKVTSKFYTADYKEVDGVKIPFTARIIAGPNELTMKVTEIKHNEEIPDSTFAKPADDEEEDAPAKPKDGMKPN